MKPMYRPLLALVVPVLLVLALFTLRSAHAQSQETQYHSNYPMTPGAIINVTITALNVSADGQCSLIEAIVNANNNAPTHADCTAGSGADTIELAAHGTYEATLVHNFANGPNALPSVTSEITINGNGSALQRSAAVGTPLMRLIRVGGAGTLTVNNLTLRNGYINGEAGAGILNNGGNVTLNDCTVESNTVTNWGGAGATNYYGTMTINRSIFLENHADSSGMAGGAILHWANSNDATLYVYDSQFISNTVAGGGGAIASLVSLTNNVRTTINGSTFIGNVDSESDPLAPFGGGALVINMQGVGNTSFVTVTNSIFTNNRSASYGGAILHLATHFSDSTSILTVSDSLITGNHAIGESAGTGLGGGIATFAGENFISKSTIRDNVASGGDGVSDSGNGGGLYNQARMTLNRTTLSKNLATGNGVMGSGWGGGIAHLDLTDTITNALSLTIVNSTISGNQAVNTNPQTVDGGAGGGLTAGGVGNDPVTATLINSTFADNSATRTGGGVSTFNSTSTVPVQVNFVNTIVGDNTAPTNPSCTIGSQSSALSQGYNLEDGNTCNFTQTGDLPNTDPQLAPLGDHGGPTWTHALKSGSPALNAGNDTVCSTSPVNGIDQRGIPRLQMAHCDIGSYEMVNATAVTLDNLSASAETPPFLEVALMGFAVLALLSVWRRSR